MAIMYRQESVKCRLDFTKAENAMFNRCLTDI